MSKLLGPEKRKQLQQLFDQGPVRLIAKVTFVWGAMTFLLLLLLGSFAGKGRLLQVLYSAPFLVLIGLVWGAFIWWRGIVVPLRKDAAQRDHIAKNSGEDEPAA